MLFAVAILSVAQSMPRPPGFTKLVFDDKFAGTALDSAKWIPQIAAQNGIWDNFGHLAYPLSAVGNAGKFKAEYGDPRELSVHDGLTLTARRDSSQAGYTWRAGYICTHGKFAFDHGYAQIRARMPDSRSGGWGAIWFLEGGEEIDLMESGFLGLGREKANQVVASDFQGDEQVLFDSGVDLSANYHTYGMEYRPGISISMYFDGKRIASYTKNISKGAYTIVLTNTVAQKTGRWHTVPDDTTPEALTMQVSEVQVWQ